MTPEQLDEKGTEFGVVSSNATITDVIYASMFLSCIYHVGASIVHEMKNISLHLSEMNDRD